MAADSQEEDSGLKVAMLTSDDMPSDGGIHAANSRNGICECHDPNCRDSRRTSKGLKQVVRPDTNSCVRESRPGDHWASA